MRDVAKLLDLTEPEIRTFIRAGFLEPRRGKRGEYRFTLQDLVLLRTAKGLSASVPVRKVKRALRNLREHLPSGRPLTGLRILTDGSDVVVREGGSVWDADSGQGRLDFDVAELADKVAPLARRAAEEARETPDELAPEDWFHLACDLEPTDPDQARDAYRRALELDPENFDARLNLGRLLHEAGQTEAAERHYRLALRIRPAEAIAAFNLGVALEDLERRDEAVRAYEHAIVLDPDMADAHYNLAYLFEKEGRKTAAFRHLKAYKQIIERP